jgi:hypothetical protein
MRTILRGSRLLQYKTKAKGSQSGTATSTTTTTMWSPGGAFLEDATNLLD